MTEAANHKVLAVAHRIMRPIARLMIRSSITYRDFSELCKAVFVEVACEDYGLQGRPANTSRVAIVTGLSRKDVKKTRDRLKEGSNLVGNQVSNASRVLGAWHREPDYVDANGKPRELELDRGNPSFATLLKQHGGDMPPGALLKELKHVGAVVETDTGRLRAEKRYYMPEQLDAINVARSGEVLHDMATTVVHNLLRTDKEPSRFEGRASNPRISARALPAFRKLVEKQSEAFLYAMDDWLSENEVPADNKDERTTGVGVGVYQIEHKTDWRTKT